MPSQSVARVIGSVFGRAERAVDVRRLVRHLALDLAAFTLHAAT
jgi:hypothetical protein